MWSLRPATPSPELTLREIGIMLARRRAIIYISLSVFFLLGDPGAHSFHPAL